MNGRRAGRRFDDDHGAVLMEFALILPFLALMTCGLIDYGFAYRQQNQVQSALASAGRTVSQVGSQNVAGRADYAALQNIASVVSGMKKTQLIKVIIWKATTLTDPQCLTVALSTTSPAGTANLCNVYSAAQVNAGDIGNFAGSRAVPACPSTAWDYKWCPLNRDDQDSTADLVGVYIEIEYTPFTKFVTKQPIRISESTVYRIEPQY